MSERDIINNDDINAKRTEHIKMPPPPKTSKPVKPFPDYSEGPVEIKNKIPVGMDYIPVLGTIKTVHDNEETAGENTEKIVKPSSDDAVRTRPTIAERKAKSENTNGKPKSDASSERVIGFSQADYLDWAGFKRRKPKKTLTGKAIAGRVAVSLVSVLLFAVIAVFGLCFTIAKGPSETVRNLLVLSAKQASATKWVPGLFLDDETINEILANSAKVETDVMSIEDYYSEDNGGNIDRNEWENAKDGMIFKTLKGASYTAYMLIVRDPSRVFVGASSDDYSTSSKGKNIFEATEKFSAVAAINGGEFPDSGGIGTGSHPIGLTYSGGKCIWNDGTKRTFIGFDKDNKLHAYEGMTKAEADKLSIRDAVSFQTGNVLISSDGENVTFYYAEGNNGTAQRTAIGQRADGAVIMLVTDGRTASSLGATHNDVIDIMVEHGAVTAAMLDGGSSAMMYYEDYYEKYDYDYESLDQYQKRGLVNKYKAFTNPRYMPTFFMVNPVSEGGDYNAD
ncbi:MAG: phosphodiester glycosidase family protein [Clostridia bacterium]|nr:phosphodiester glycosidase family protein [Clostridia bacterium]